MTAMPRVGLNPYALGMRLFYAIEELADKGKYSFKFRSMLDAHEREQFDTKTGQGKVFLFKVRGNFCDFTFINTFVDQDFINQQNLFVTGRRLNQSRMMWEYYVKSRKAKDYRQMLFDSLYHPPSIEIAEKMQDHTLYLIHRFEEKPLVTEFIVNTMMGLEYLWGGTVQLETSEVVAVLPLKGIQAISGPPQEERQQPEVQWQRLVYTMQNRKLSKKTL